MIKRVIASSLTDPLLKKRKSIPKEVIAIIDNLSSNLRATPQQLLTHRTPHQMVVGLDEASSLAKSVTAQ